MFRAKLLGVVLVACLVSLGSVATAQVEYTADANTVLLMHFNEGSGQAVGDASKNLYWDGNDGYRGDKPTEADNQDPFWTTGKFGSALEFGSGTSSNAADVVHVLNSDTLNMGGSDAFTMECWFSPAVALGPGLGKYAAASLMSYGQLGVSKTAQYKIVYEKAAGKLYAQIYTPTGYKSAVSTTDSWTAGEWYHVAGVYDGSTIKIYVNGVLQATTDAEGIVTSTYLHWRAGADQGRNFGWDGRIDEVRISKVARAADELSPNMYDLAAAIAAIQTALSEPGASGIAQYVADIDEDLTTVEDDVDTLSEQVEEILEALAAPGASGMSSRKK